jgi:hypothetical protein
MACAVERSGLRVHKLITQNGPIDQGSSSHRGRDRRLDLKVIESIKLKKFGGKVAHQKGDGQGSP